MSTYQELNLAHPEHLWHLVYLTPYGSDPSPMSISSKDWEKWKNQQSTALAYTDLSDWLTHTSSLSLNPKVKNFLDAFHAYINNKFIGLNDMSEHEIIEKIINKNDDFHLIFEKIYRHSVQIKYELNKKIAKLKEYFHVDNKKIKVLMNVYAKKDPSMLLCCLYFDFKIKELKAFIDINAYHHGYEVTLAERTYNLNQTVLLQEILHLLGYESLPLTSNNRVLVFSYSKDVDQHQIYEDVDKLINDLIEYHLSTIN
ncbi:MULTISPECIES: hypothetical protein [Acinetobacter]|uniref:Uncharacterized protein n=1 Tax=Acinetobacter towneri TaxID=202956 RepID=A0ABX7T9M7_9GAMM|nr:MULTISPECIES: hypothetical protein [Acinetobacter]QTD58554.1 hypothetical protein J4G44_09475 [Acinetobacter towneri]QTD60636.1 hypothetical protein J4G45_07240 [Acinetobacter towneri]